MPQLDYHKVISIIGRTLESEADIAVQKTADRSEVFNITFSDRNGSKKDFKMINSHFRIELQVGRSQFDEKTFNRWIKSFEYDLEQAFFTNIKVTVENDASLYRIIVTT